MCAAGGAFAFAAAHKHTRTHMAARVRQLLLHVFTKHTRCPFKEAAATAELVEMLTHHEFQSCSQWQW